MFGLKKIGRGFMEFKNPHSRFKSTFLFSFLIASVIFRFTDLELRLPFCGSSTIDKTSVDQFYDICSKSDWSDDDIMEEDEGEM